MSFNCCPEIKALIRTGYCIKYIVCSWCLSQFGIWRMHRWCIGGITVNTNAGSHSNVKSKIIVDKSILGSSRTSVTLVGESWNFSSLSAGAMPSCDHVAETIVLLGWAKWSTIMPNRYVPIQTWISPWLSSTKRLLTFAPRDLFHDSTWMSTNSNL